jgi:hypothetical protein
MVGWFTGWSGHVSGWLRGGAESRVLARLIDINYSDEDPAETQQTRATTATDGAVGYSSSSLLFHTFPLLI